MQTYILSSEFYNLFFVVIISSRHFYSSMHHYTPEQSTSSLLMLVNYHVLKNEGKKRENITVLVDMAQLYNHDECSETTGWEKILILITELYSLLIAVQLICNNIVQKHLKKKK